MPPALRTALDQGGGPTVAIVRRAPPVFVPGRNLWVLLLAASLLTGPLVESVPGERAQRTWETLRTASVSTLELFAGKWAAWTAATLGVAATGLLAGLLSGTQVVDAALVGVPLVVAAVVALGLWLLRDAEDPAGAATIPVRTVPLVLLGTAALSLAVADGAPLLAGFVPIGGALLLAAGPPEAWSLLPGAVVSSAVTTVGLLWHASAKVDRPRAPSGRAAAAAGPLLAGLGVWATTIWAPHAWEAVGSVLRPPPGPSLLACGLGLGLVAGVTALRDPTPPPSVVRPVRARHLVAAAGLGLVLALIDLVLSALPAQGPLREAMLGPPAAPLWAALLCAAGKEMLFRDAVLRRAGPWVAAAAWALVTHPLDPAAGLAGGVALGFAVRWWGLSGSLVARLVWAGVRSSM